MTESELDRLAELILTKLIARAAGVVPANDQYGVRPAVDSAPAARVSSDPTPDDFAKLAQLKRRKGIR